MFRRVGYNRVGGLAQRLICQHYFTQVTKCKLEKEFSISQKDVMDPKVLGFLLCAHPTLNPH